MTHQNVPIAKVEAEETTGAPILCRLCTAGPEVCAHGTCRVMQERAAERKLSNA
jgi:hypothetical protein